MSRKRAHPNSASQTAPSNRLKLSDKISLATLTAAIVNIGVTTWLTWYAKDQDLRLKEIEISMPLVRKDAADIYPPDVILAAKSRYENYFKLSFRPLTGADQPLKSAHKGDTQNLVVVRTIKLKPCGNDPTATCPRD